MGGNCNILIDNAIKVRHEKLTLPAFFPHSISSEALELLMKSQYGYPEVRNANKKRGTLL